MKKFFVFFISTFLLFFSIPSSAADTTTVVLTERPHMGLDGVFYDDDLADLLLPSKRLGKLVFTTVNKNKIWYIDAALIDQVVAMVDGYSVRVDARSDDVTVGNGMNVATSWLAALKKVARTNTVYALPYGAPATTWLERIAPKELRYYEANSQLKVIFYVGKYVDIAAHYPGQKAPGVPGEVQKTYNNLRNEITGYLKVLDIQDTDPYRLGIAQLANTSLSRNESIQLSRRFSYDFTTLNKRLRVVSGKYTITAAKEEIPMTIVNGFNKDITLSIAISALNGKVVVTPIPDITIAAQSKLIVPVPVRVIASGNSTLMVQLAAVDKTPVGNSVLMPLRLSVISPIATWVTTGSAVVLLLAGVTQSVRRVKKRRHE